MRPHVERVVSTPLYRFLMEWACGGVTSGTAKMLVRDGLVSVNGAVVTEPWRTIVVGDYVTDHGTPAETRKFDGRLIK